MKSFQGNVANQNDPTEIYIRSKGVHVSTSGKLDGTRRALRRRQWDIEPEDGETKGLVVPCPRGTGQSCTVTGPGKQGTGSGNPETGCRYCSLPQQGTSRRESTGCLYPCMFCVQTPGSTGGYRHHQAGKDYKGAPWTPIRCNFM